jgi:hypothetical protein
MAMFFFGCFLIWVPFSALNSLSVYRSRQEGGWNISWQATTMQVIFIAGGPIFALVSLYHDME